MGSETATKPPITSPGIAHTAIHSSQRVAALISAMCEAYYIPVSPHDAAGPINVVAGAQVMMTVPNFYKLETSEWNWKGTPWLLTASFGVAHWPDTSRHVDNLFAQADASLYDAKRRGRNRVTGSRTEPINR